MESGERRPRLNNKTLFVLGAMNLIDCINVNLLTPYVDRMVSTFLDTDPEDPMVSRTVGLLIGLYSLCEVIFSVFWGALADRIGRKPALLIGLGGSVIAPILFGIGTDLTTVFIARGLDGFFCGNMGVTRTYLGEIVDESNEARGFGFLALCFSLGLFIGPMLGGELVYPAETFPKVFRGTVFETYPFLLPNLTYAVCAAVAWVIGAIFLEETLPRAARRGCCRRDEAAEAMVRQLSRSQSERACGADPGGTPRWLPDGGEGDERAIADFHNGSGSRAVSLAASEPRTGGARTVEIAPSPEAAAHSSRWYPPTLLRVILAYCAISGWAAANSQMFVVIVSYPQSSNGFGLSPSEIGLLQNVAALGLLLTQCLLYGPVMRRVGFFACFYFGFSTNVILYALFPVYGLFASVEKYGGWRFLPLSILQFGTAVGGCFMFPTTFALINRASHGLDKGAANGLANSAGALCRAVFPPVAGWVLSVGNQMGSTFGRYLAVYCFIAVASGLVVFAAPGVRAAAHAGVAGARAVQPPETPCAQKREVAPSAGTAVSDSSLSESGRQPLVPGSGG